MNVVIIEEGKVLETKFFPQDFGPLSLIKYKKMEHIKKRKIFIPIVMASLITTLGIGAMSYPDSARASSSSRVTASYNTTGNRYGFGKGKGQGASGVVTAISGPLLTISGKNNATYAVDTSKATLLKMNTISGNGVKIPGVPTAIALSDIKVGDAIMIRGEISKSLIKTIIWNQNL